MISLNYLLQNECVNGRAFRCHRLNGSRRQEWDARLEYVRLSGDSYQLRVSALGYSYTAIVGMYVNGYYICIPALSAGADLANLNDTRYNEYKLKEARVSGRLVETFSQSLAVFHDILYGED